MANGKRLLFFDLLRIVAVGMVVLCHILIPMGLLPEGHLTRIFQIYYWNIGIIGVYILIFVSGATLEYSHANLRGLQNISDFYLQRLVRIYPAYWISLVIGLLTMPYFVTMYPARTFVEFAGFAPYIAGGWFGLINPMGWFIGLIVVLYMLYPILSPAIRKYPAAMLVLLAVVEVFSRYFLTVNYFPSLGYLPDRYLPICNLLEFGLGIFIVQQGFFPRTENKSPTVLFLAEISFYVYLVNWYPAIHDLPAGNLVEYLVIVTVLAFVVMVSDERIQSIIRKKIKTGSPPSETSTTSNKIDIRGSNS